MLKDKFDRYFFLQRDDNVCGKLIKYLIVGISRIFHSYGHVTTSGEDLCSALMTIQHWGLFSLPPLLWQYSECVLIKELPGFRNLLQLKPTAILPETTVVLKLIKDAI